VIGFIASALYFVNFVSMLWDPRKQAWMDRAAYLAATRRARGTCVTRKVDEIEFRTPIFSGDFVELIGRVESVGRTSMVVVVEVHREIPDDASRELCTTGRFTMVHVGDDGHPLAIPPAN
jgi:acyl-CoA hydrolase